MSSIYNKIAWSEGMLLKPQHFQQQERYFESLIFKQLQYTQAYYWGFYQLSLDKEALTNGKIALKEAKGLFKEGSVFNIPVHDKAPRCIHYDETHYEKTL